MKLKERKIKNKSSSYLEIRFLDNGDIEIHNATSDITNWNFKPNGEFSFV